MWYPKAIRKEIPPGGNDPTIIPVGIVYHVRDGIGESLYPYFSGPSGGIESHWYIRYDGTVEQYRDSRREADANGKGNSWVVGGKRYGLHSVETEGREKGKWTAEQIQALKELTVWDARFHGWPLQLCPDWNGPGVGYHVMFGAPGPWTGVAKTCPGPDRVRQFEQIFVPWLASGGKPTPIPPAQEDDDMPTPRELWQYRNDKIEKGDTFGLLVEAYRRAGAAEKAAEYANAQLNSIASGVSAIAKALIDGKIDVAELQRVNDGLAGKAKGLSRADTTD
jgi:hypothetical protein